ncbi:unnamed protein product, partial [Mesorhabditis spiculigera]
MSIATRETLKLSAYEPLEGIAKQECPTCKRRRMFFCYDCRQPMAGVFCPQVELPCLVDIIKHPKEKNSKSTAIHCKITAPKSTTLYSLDDIPNYSAEANTVLVFPSDDAISVEDYVKQHGEIKRFVVLDSTWFQTSVMQRIPEIKGLPCVHLKNYRTAFWRPQHKLDEHHLATIEAIYYALVEYHNAKKEREYEGEFDDLLYWFMLMRGKYDTREEAYFKRKAEDEADALAEGSEAKKTRANS